MFRSNSHSQRGDTLVEVLLATVVLSMVLASSFTISNRATRINRQSLEKTEVSNYLREQAEQLKRGMDSGAPLTTAQGEIDAITPGYCDGVANGPGFHIDSSSGTLTYGEGPLQIGDFYYVWIERPASISGETIDFTIRACWAGIGDVPNQTSGIVVRLNL